MRNTAAKLTFIIFTFNVILKEDAICKTRPKPKK